ncbi:MAG: hypothetical protein AMXMBFR4_02410 [Candidatus Hydrogenedentota bacterium]
MQWSRIVPVAFAITVCAYSQVNYDIVYVRQPRFGDNQHILWPEIGHPARVEAGCDLMLLHPDGSEEVLVAAGAGSVTDPFVSFDGQWVYYAFFHQVDPVGAFSISKAGSDIFKINVTTREVVQLTHGEFTPNMGMGIWDVNDPANAPGWAYNSLGHGVINLGPCPVAGGKVAFVSNRNGYMPPKEFYTVPTLQLYVMDEDGSNVLPIAPMSIGSALHPTPLMDGRLVFSSYESQGLRDVRMWGLWAIYPDGRHWEPVISSYRYGQAFHFMTQLSDGDLVVEDYYNFNNFGFGTLYRMPPKPPAGEPPFHSPYPNENPGLTQVLASGLVWPVHMGFTPKGISVITPFTTGADEAAPVGANGQRVGKFTHPSGAPNNDLLVVWSPGPVNALTRPTQWPAADSGIYLIPGGNAIDGPEDLVKLKDRSSYNEVWPRAVVPYSEIYGISEPERIPWLPNDGSEHDELPAGTPYGLVGTSSLLKRDTFPGYVRSWSNAFDGLDAFNTTENEQSSNWLWQGADAGKYSDKDIWAVRIIAMEPNTDRNRGPNLGRHFFNHARERMRILGEIPVRKFNPDGSPVRDGAGNIDTSFLAKIPADTPFTFQTLDRRGMVLNMAQTWHQVRPGEVRNDCGGCHAHSQMPLDFNLTAASSPDYDVWDLANATPLLNRTDAAGETTVKTVNQPVVNVEFYQDIRPILKKHCAPCHTKKSSSPPGNLVLDDRKLYNGLPGDYLRLALDTDARWGYKPLVTVAGKPQWRQTNASRYVRQFQSRRSLLTWKVFGQRLDGWKNKDHPTEKVPGDPSTLSGNPNINDCDLDFTGTIMPPPNSGVKPLTENQKMTIARWIDLGCPIDTRKGTPDAKYGWFGDDLRPTLTVSAPRPGANPGPLGVIRVGFADAYTGIKPGSLSIVADFPVNGRQPGQELADLAQGVADGVYAIHLSQPLPAGSEGNLYVEVADVQGNITQVDVAFSVI